MKGSIKWKRIEEEQPQKGALCKYSTVNSSVSFCEEANRQSESKATTSWATASMLLPDNILQDRKREK